jgi:hypothetical protein
MLAPADADLVRRDLALRGLGTLLDPEAFALALGSCIRDLTPGSARLLYLRYKPSWSCLAAFRVEVAGNPLDVYAKALARDAGLEFAEATGALGTPHSRGIGRLTLPDGATVVCLYPDDLRLPDLDLVLDAAPRRRALRRLLPARSELWEAEASLLGYRPERRHVSRLRTREGPGAVLKLHARKGFAAAQRGARALRSGSLLRIAPLLGSSERLRAIALGWLEGRPLRDLVRGSEPLAAPLAAVGRALAELHAQLPDLAPRPRRTALRALRAEAIRLGFLLPDAAKRVAGLADAIAQRLQALPEPSCCVHGDFYDKQVVLMADGVGILDLDGVAIGDPGADLGLFFAHLALDVEMGRLAEARAAEAGAALLEGYRAQGGAAPVGAHTAAALLGLASYPFRRRDPEWPQVFDQLLSRAEQLLAAG